MARQANWNGVQADKTAYSLARILIASYFIAKSTGLVVDATGADVVFPPALSGDIANMAGNGILFVLAYALMVGYRTHLAALLLAICVFWTSFVLNYALGDAPVLSAFWRDLALIGGLLMVSIHSLHANPAQRRRRPGSGVMRPRRIVPKGTSGRPRPDETGKVVPLKAPAVAGKTGNATLEACENLFAPDVFAHRSAAEAGAR